jgi:hypothetical protein
LANGQVMESGRVGMENALAGHEEIGIDVD